MITRIAAAIRHRNVGRSTRLSAGLALVAALACGPSEQSPADSAADSTRALAPADTPGRLTPAEWRVSARVAGQVRVGMTPAEAEAALGAALERIGPPDALGTCRYVRPPAPKGVAFMVVDGRVARVDIDSAVVPTVEGARVGVSENRVQQLYAGRVAVSSHKYVDGHYLTVTPAAAADSGYRIIFETDGQRVTRYRAGRLPEVAWVEGCS